VLCRTCLRDITPGVEYCPSCGVPAQPENRPVEDPLYCTVCGASIGTAERYCARCGNAVKAPPAAKDTPSRGMAGVGYVGFWTRLGAQIIDAIIYWVLVVVMVAIGSSAPLILIAFILVIIYGVYRHLKCQTLGRRVLGIMVVDDSGKAVGFWRGALREIIGKFVSGILLYLGYLWIAFDPNKQGWHDKVARTYVVRQNATPSRSGI